MYHRSLRDDKVFSEVRQDEEPQLMIQDRSFDSIKLKYLNFDSIKYVMFTKLESSTSQKRTCMTYKIDS